MQSSPTKKKTACRKRTPIKVPARVAIRVPYVPSFTGEIEGWVTNHLKANYWRVQATQERDDVMQEARVVFLRVAQKYPGTEPAHFMALFKTAWTRHFHDLSSEDSAHREVFVGPVPEDDEGVTLEAVGETDNAGMLRLMVQQAPREVRTVLALFLNAPAELLEAAVASWREDRRCRNPSEKICRMLGLPLDLDVMQKTADYFGGHSR